MNLRKGCLVVAPVNYIAIYWDAKFIVCNNQQVMATWLLLPCGIG